MKFYNTLVIILIYFTINVKAQNLGSQKNDDISFANSNNYSIKNNGENRICIQPSKSGLIWKNEAISCKSICIKYNKNDIAVEQNNYYLSLEDAENAFTISLNNFTTEIIPNNLIPGRIGGGKYFNPKTKEYIQLLVQEERNWYCVTYSF